MVDNAENISEVKKFLKRGHLKEVNVSFSGFDNIPEIGNKVVVSISDHLDFYNVNINWEDEPFRLRNYKNFGLYGYYSTGYCNMKYNDSRDELIITDTNGRSIILSK